MSRNRSRHSRLLQINSAKTSVSEAVMGFGQGMNDSGFEYRAAYAVRPFAAGGLPGAAYCLLSITPGPIIRC
jgi:hypothetical protein